MLLRKVQTCIWKFIEKMLCRGIGTGYLYAILPRCHHIYVLYKAPTILQNVVRAGETNLGQGKKALLNLIILPPKIFEANC